MAVSREHGTTGQTAASSLRLFRIVALHDVETMLRNPSVLVCCVLVVVMGWLFDSVLQFWPWFTCAAIGSLAVGVPTAIGMLVAFAEEHEYGMGETLARVGVARRCRVAAKALAGFALAEVLMCALALSMGLGMRGALLVAALAVPTTAFMALACAALAARVVDQQRAGSWGAAVMLPPFVAGMLTSLGLPCWMFPGGSIAALCMHAMRTGLISVEPLAEMGVYVGASPAAVIAVSMLWVAAAFIACWRTLRRA